MARPPLCRGLTKAMARPPRLEYDGAFYQVTSRGNERQAVFFADGITRIKDCP